MRRSACVAIAAVAMLAAACRGSGGASGGSGSASAGSGASTGSASIGSASIGSASIGSASASNTATGSAAGVAAGVRADEHVAYRFVDNRHAAHRAAGGALVVDAGDIGFARFTRFGMPAPRWHLGRVLDNVRVAVADREATLVVPLPRFAATHPQSLELRVRAAAVQSLAVRVNGRRIGAAKLAAGWQTVVVPIAPGELAVGENQLGLETRGPKQASLALAWLRIGEAPPAVSPAADPLAAATFDPASDALALARDAELAWYLAVPDGAAIVAEVAAPCRIEVAARAGDDSLAAGVLAADHPRVELSAAAGKVVRLALTARDCAVARAVHPAIALVGPPPRPLPAADPPRVVMLWSMTGLGADPGARTPNLDELARASTAFRVAYTQGADSATSHASLWTGRYPAAHGALPADAPTIATELAAAGVTAIARTGDFDVDADDGYARGFADFRNVAREHAAPPPSDDAQVADALAQLAAHRDAPTYLYLETTGAAASLGLHGATRCASAPPAAALADMRARYAAAVAAQDKLLGTLVAELRRTGVWDQTLLVVTSVHGEELAAGARCGDASLRDAVVRVPLVIHDPARFPAGQLVDDGAELVDIFPTILAALRRAVPPGVQGTALEPLAQGAGRNWPRAIYAGVDTGIGAETAHALRVGRWQIRVAATGIPVVADVVADPDATADLAPARPIETRMLTDDLGLFLALRADWQAAWGTPANVTAAGAAALDAATTH